MIDYLVLVLHSLTMRDFQKFLDLIDVKMPNEAEQMVVYFENLRIEYYPNSQILKMKNSLHRFHNRVYADIKIDGNYNDFCFTDFYAICDLLSTLYFERDIKDFKVSTKFETGLNIDVGGYKPMDIMERYLSFQSHNSIVEIKTMEPWGGAIGKPTTMKGFMSDYQIKCYNKSVESKLVGINLMRLEVVYGELRKLRSVLGLDSHAEISLENLNQIESWKTLGGYIMSCYNNIKKIPLTDRDLTIDELNKIYAYCHKGLKKDLFKNLSRHYHTKYMDECKEVYNHIAKSEDNYHNVIEQKMLDKIEFLWKN